MADAFAVHIPIKTNNERLPGKNTRLLCGRPLYEYLFATVRKLEGCDVYVDTSDKAMLEVASAWGFHPLERPVALNSNSTTGDELLARAVSFMNAPLIAQLHVTSPFLRRRTVEGCVDLLNKSPEVDSVLAVCPRYNRFWYQGKPVNHNPNRLARTQALEPVLEEADFYVFRRTSFLRLGRRAAGVSRVYSVDEIEAVDIDTVGDFLYAEALLKAKLVSAE